VAGRAAEIDLYPANHGFGNPWAYGYDRDAAAAAWKRTLDFLRSSLKSSAASIEGTLHAQR
jgi:dienelactone hydrolase